MNFKAFSQCVGIGKSVTEVKDLFRAYNIHMEEEEEDDYMTEEPTFIEPIIEMTYDEDSDTEAKMDMSTQYWPVNSDHWKAKQQLLELEHVESKMPRNAKLTERIKTEIKEEPEEYDTLETLCQNLPKPKMKPPKHVTIIPNIPSLNSQAEKTLTNFIQNNGVLQIRKKPKKHADFNSNGLSSADFKKREEEDDPLDPTGMHSCDLCSATFRIKHSITKHKRVVHGMHQFTCMFCNASYPLKRNLVEHIPTHRGPHGFRCNICKKVRPNYISIQRHVKTHAEKNIPCPKCTARFKTRWELKSHSIQHQEDRSFACQMCELEFRNPTKLREHMVRHKGPRQYSCDICFKEFATKGNFNNHRKLHFDEKPYKCQYCSSSFYTLTARKKHFSVHAAEVRKPFECKDCAKKYTSSTSLAVHRLKYHNGKKTLSCNHCEEMFSSKTAIANHLIIHARPHACQQCLCRYKNRKELLRHQRRKNHRNVKMEKKEVNDDEAYDSETQ